jgi:hypothetical protein
MSLAIFGMPTSSSTWKPYLRCRCFTWLTFRDRCEERTLCSTPSSITYVVYFLFTNLANTFFFSFCVKECLFSFEESRICFFFVLCDERRVSSLFFVMFKILLENVKV